MNNGLGGDQERYLLYAKNLLNGNYAIDGPLFLWNGPGYPIILSLFVYLNLSIVGLKSLNILFLFFGILFFYKTCCEHFNKKQALLFSYLLGLYYPHVLFSLRYILTEGFAFFLACGLLYFINASLQKPSKKRIKLASLFLAFLILTKVLFAYVVVALIGVSLFFIIFKKYRKEVYRLIIICLLANIMTLPYLFYTYSLTGVFPYYANSGGQCIYWLSTPYEGEQGEWILASDSAFKNKEQYENHNDFLSSVNEFEPVKKDRALKEKAFDNIIKHPKKFLKNYISNVSRLFLDIPNSYTYQGFSFILLAIPNSFIFVFLCLSIILTILYYKRMPLIVLICALFSIIYLFGISLLCAYSRMLFPILPLLCFWIFYMIKFWKTADATH
jgi:4-amino-4-deoxy-L-arabinose transferase-like glycosyltransferase